MTEAPPDPDRLKVRVPFPPAGVVLLVGTMTLLLFGAWLALQGIAPYASEEPERRIAQGQLGLVMLAMASVSLMATLVVAAVRSIAQQQLTAMVDLQAHHDQTSD